MKVKQEFIGIEQRMVKAQQSIKSCRYCSGITIYHVSSSPVWTGSGGLLLLNRAALPLIKEMESLWNSLWMEMLSSSPVCLASMLPSRFSSVTALGCQAPRHSAASGMKLKPWR